MFDARQLKLSRKVLLLVSIPLTFELIFLALLLAMCVDMKDEIAREKQAHVVLSDLNRVLSTSEQSYLLFGKSIELKDDRYFEEFLVFYPSQHKNIDRLKVALADNPEDNQTVEQMGDAFFKAIEHMKVMKRTHDNDRKTYFEAIMRLYLNANDFNHDAQQLYTKYHNLEEKRAAEMIERRRLLSYSACTGLGISFIIAILLASTFARGISNRVSKLLDNCMALGMGKPVEERLTGIDELKELDDAFHELARIIANASKQERLYIENARAVVFALDESGRFTSVSPTVAELWGYTVDELLLTRLHELVDQKDANRLIELISKISANEVAELIEVSLIKKDGSKAHVLLSLVWNHWETSIFGVAHDISARKLSHAKMLESEAKQQSILRNVPAGIITIDALGRIESMNPWAEMLFETATGSERGKQVERLFDKMTVLGAEAALTQEGVGKRPGGFFPAQIAVCNITTDGLKRLLIVEDLTERMELERKKHEFIATIRSDMRRPLVAARRVLQELQQDESVQVNESGKSSILAGQRSLQRSIGLINDLLDLESLKTGHVHIERGPTNLATIISESVDSVVPVAAKKKVAIRADDTSVELSADAERLVQVVTNLLTNAIKFSAEGKAIEIKVNREDGFAVVQVIDQGRGIPADRIDLVFEKYRQVKDSDSARGVGSGLRLTICREIVEAHGGTIGVTSEESVGSVFSFRLPVEAGQSSTSSGGQSTEEQAT